MFLASLESHAFRRARQVEVLRAVSLATGKPAFIARISPGVPEDLAVAKCSDDVVLLTDRHEGYDITDIRSFPHFVFICGVPSAWRDIHSFSKETLVVLAWGELYKTMDDAENQNMTNTSP